MKYRLISNDLIGTSSVIRRRTIRSHRELILNNLKVTFGRAYGYKQFKTTEMALDHSLGKLSEPPFTHGFF